MNVQSHSGDMPTGNKWRGLGVRLAAAAVMIPCVLAITWWGGVWFVAMIALIGVAAAAEWVRMVFDGSRLQLALHASAVIIAAGFALKFTLLSSAALIAFIWSASLMVAGASRQPINLWTFFGVPYVAVPMAAFVHLRMSPDHGLLAVLWIFAVVWLADTLAYGFGRTIGGPKLAPRVSPNKTWAGLAGAAAGGVAGSVIVAVWGGLDGLVALMVLAAAMGVVGQLGDLYESAAKRRSGLKDSGSIIPGHGGVLDRVDALLAVGVAALIVGVTRNGLHDAAGGLLIW